MKYSGNLPEQLGLIVPIGLSFYTFQATGYIIDVYRNKYPAEQNFCKYLLFISFFPQTIQGPIGRYDILSPTLLHGNKWDDINITTGIQKIIWGLFKKLLIADRASVLAGFIIDKYTDYDGSMLFIAILTYSIQIYCDFSGGIDISRGAADLFGVKLDNNFKRPFFAASVADFWRRWHITLGTWLKDYLFYPLTLSPFMTKISRFSRKLLGTSKGKMVPACVSTFVVYIIVGIWHGADLKFTAFGIYNGIIITASIFFESYFVKIRNLLDLKKHSIFRILCIFRTFIIICFARFFTRANSLSDALNMIKQTLLNFKIQQLLNGTILSTGLSSPDLLVLLISVCVLFVVEIAAEGGFELSLKYNTSNAAFKYALLFVSLFCILVFGFYSTGYVETSFIYAQY